MIYTANNPTADYFFGQPEATYTRAQAIADGVLIDLGSVANEAGIIWPVAMTTDAWADCVAWTEADSARQVHQDPSGRLWDVIYMASHAIRTCKERTQALSFPLYRVPRDGKSIESELVSLKLVIGPGDASEPVITMLLPYEA